MFLMSLQCHAMSYDWNNIVRGLIPNSSPNMTLWTVTTFKNEYIENYFFKSCITPVSYLKRWHFLFISFIHRPLVHLQLHLYCSTHLLYLTHRSSHWCFLPTFATYIELALCKNRKLHFEILHSAFPILHQTWNLFKHTFSDARDKKKGHSWMWSWLWKETGNTDVI